MEAQTLRQILVLTGLTLCSISGGYILGQSSGMIDALRSENSTIVITEDELYWIASSIQITCFCGFAIVGILTEILGRKKTISILNIPILISWIIVYFANSMTTLLISRIILGLSYGGVLLLTYICVGEYASPNIRSLSLNLMGSVGSLLGTSLAHLLSLLLHWKTVALIGIVPTIPVIVIPFFWVESPAWLASKGRFKECKQSFQALHVKNDVTKRELALLISLEFKGQSNFKKNMGIFETMITKIWIAVNQRYFWKISILNTTINIYRIAGGRILFTTLAITILKDITGDNDILKQTIFIDCFFILGAMLSCILVKRFKMRSLLFTTGIAANIVLLILALFIYLYPGKDYIINWVKVALFAVYFITIMAGPYGVLETLLTEIIPLRVKTFFIFFFGAIVGVFQFLAIKLIPAMLEVIGYHGIFFLNAGIIFISMLYLWFYLPETKGKSLEEIECYFKDIEERTNDLESNDQYYEIIKLTTCDVTLVK